MSGVQNNVGGPKLCWGSNWGPIGSLGITCIHLGSLGITWDHLESLGITLDHLGSFGITWDHLDHLVSLGITWDQLGSLGITAWDHLGSKLSGVQNNVGGPN